MPLTNASTLEPRWREVGENRLEPSRRPPRSTVSERRAPGGLIAGIPMQIDLSFGEGRRWLGQNRVCKWQHKESATPNERGAFVEC